MEDTLSSLSLLQRSLSRALLRTIAYFYTVHSHQKSIGSFQFMTRITSHGTRFPAILQQDFNRVQLTVLKSFISSYFFKKEGSTLPSFLYSVEYLTYHTAKTAYLNKLSHDTASTTAWYIQQLENTIL
jgi:hypothetical protein